jgi:outer membrane receptor protein involved in Fe transport
VDGGAEAPQLTGKRPAQAPIWSATAGAAWRPLPRVRLQADLRWESARFEDDLNSRRLGAALQADGVAELELGRGAAVYLAAENLLDEDVEVAETADGVESYGAPRTVRIGLRLRR